MKKALKVLSLVLVFALAFAPMALAGGMFDLEPTEVEGTDMIKTGANQVIWIIQLVGYALAAIIAVWMGIQWILATPSKKAELKGKLWSVLVGIILLVGSTSLLPIIWDAIAGAF